MSQSILFINTIWILDQRFYTRSLLHLRRFSFIFITPCGAAICCEDAVNPSTGEVLGTRSSVQSSPPEAPACTADTVTHSTCLQRLPCPRPSPVSARLIDLPRSQVLINVPGRLRRRGWGGNFIKPTALSRNAPPAKPNQAMCLFTFPGSDWGEEQEYSALTRAHTQSRYSPSKWPHRSLSGLLRQPEPPPPSLRLVWQLLSQTL